MLSFLSVLRKSKLLKAKKLDYQEMMESQPSSAGGSFTGNI
jgi:hypothetical protein